MALILHRCTRCGHPDYWRQGGVDKDGRRAGPCACGHQCRPSQTGPPEVAPTFDGRGARIERIAEPGRRLNDTTNLTPCGCADCKALHAQLTTV